jgi:hypothetical protein
MITPETNQVKSKFFENLSRLVYGLTPEDFFSIKTNKGKVKGTILDYLKVFDRQFVDPATKEPREQEKILRKNFYSFDVELFYISETDELKVLDFGKRTTKPPSLTKFKLTSAITDTKTLKEYLSIKEQEKRFLFVFDKIKNKAIKTLEFWLSIELEESKRFLAVLSNKLPIEFISNKELELIFTNYYNKLDKSQFEFLFETLMEVTNSKSEANRIEKIYKAVLKKEKSIDNY